MSKIISKSQKALDKVCDHKYTGLTLKTPFINFSFAPTIVAAHIGLFLFGNSKAHIKNKRTHRFLIGGLYAMFSYSSKTSTISLAPSLKLF